MTGTSGIEAPEPNHREMAGSAALRTVVGQELGRSHHGGRSPPGLCQRGVSIRRTRPNEILRRPTWCRSW